MTKFKHIVLLVLVALLLSAACAKVPSGPGQATVAIRASIEGAPAATKGLVNFAKNDTYGIFTCIHEETDTPAAFAQFRPSLWNAQAYLSGGKWNYKNVVSYATGDLFSTGSGKFILVGRTDNAYADLYAYAPWTQDAYLSGPEAIPFGRQADLKYAIQNTVNGNQALDPASDAELTATFHFRRVMACIAFDFTFNTPNNTTMRVDLVSIKDMDAGGGAVLYTGGKFNAISGAVYDLQSTEELTTNLGWCTVGKDGGSFNLCIVPTEVTADDELVFTFVSGGFTLPPFKLKASQVMHSKANPGDPDVFGFKAGYKYTFHFLLDNYVRFNGFDIQPWGAPEDLPNHGVI